MRSLKSTILLLIFLISSHVVFSDDLEYPTDVEVMKMIEEHPDLVVPIVQKCWVLEHATPILILPDLIFLEVNENFSQVNGNFSQGNTNFTIVMFEDKPATLKIGTEEFNLFYDIDLDVAKVVYTQPEESSDGIPIWAVVVIGAGCFGVGFFVGYLVFH